MNFTLTIICSIAFAFLMTALGAALVFCFQKEFSPKLNAAFFGLASGIMLAAAIWSLLLPAFSQLETTWGRYAFAPIAVSFLLGAGFLYALDKILLHTQGGNSQNEQKAKKLFVAMTVHNIPEGLAAGFAFGAAFSIGTPAALVSAIGLALGLGVQNVPEGAAVSLPMYTVYKKKKRAFLCGVLSGAVEPLFAVLGFFLAAQIAVLQPWLLAFSAGTMLFVIAEDLLPDSKTEGSGALGAWSAVFGFVLMMILDVALG